jgi:ketosteroid isomerase-like protein
VLLPPGERPVSGREAIRAYNAKQRTETPFTVKVTKLAMDEVTALAPGVAACRSTLSGERTLKTGGAAAPFETKYFDVLEKTPGGKWQFRFRMWSDNTSAVK